jgi:hypothetical protein
MIDAEELEIARDELRWLLDGCTDCLAAHRLLGELAMAENDFPLARGHFGYAWQIGTAALSQAGCRGPAPYSRPANQAFLESGKGLAFCLQEMDKKSEAAAVVRHMLELDPSDPLGVSAWHSG